MRTSLLLRFSERSPVLCMPPLAWFWVGPAGVCAHPSAGTTLVFGTEQQLPSLPPLLPSSSRMVHCSSPLDEVPGASLQGLRSWGRELHCSSRGGEVENCRAALFSSLPGNSFSVATPIIFPDAVLTFYSRALKVWSDPPCHEILPEIIIKTVDPWPYPRPLKLESLGWAGESALFDALSNSVSLMPSEV